MTQPPSLQTYASKKAIIVLGMHRSGTSLLTGCLEAAGIFLGTVNNSAPHNKRGNKENEAMRDLNDEILHRHHSSWNTPPITPCQWNDHERAQGKALLSPYETLTTPWAFKDPRTIWTLSGWLDLIDNAQLLGVFRHPALAAQSLAARGGALHIPIDDGLELWKIYNQQLLSWHDQYSFPILHFDAQNLESTFLDPLNHFTHSLGLTGNPKHHYHPPLVHQQDEQLKIDSLYLSLYEKLKSRASKF